MTFALTPHDLLLRRMQTLTAERRHILDLQQWNSPARYARLRAVESELDGLWETLLRARAARSGA